MNNHDILILGAGACGLMAARELSRQGKRICILEARDRTGGRIHTIYNAPFSVHAELGPEFIHGDLPVTKKLLDEAGLVYHKTGGEMWQFKNGKLAQEDRQVEHWNVFAAKLKELETDMSINDFLERSFDDDKYGDLKASVRQYAAGYDTADPDRASALALKEEWLSDEGDQYRLSVGYSKMTDYLVSECGEHGAVIHLDTVIQNITWEEGKVVVTVEDGMEYTGRKIIITAPINVLQAGVGERASISFSPALPMYAVAIQQMGMGAIIKILLQFKEPFWQGEAIKAKTGKSMEDAGFIFSEEAIPTWWTQYPAPSSVLTGWLGGPEAAKLKNTEDATLLDMAITSLANIFGMEVDVVKERLTASYVANWTADPFALGSYSYATVDTDKARKVLEQPIAGTIFFAGEAMYDGPVMGTVEAALSNGLKVAGQVAACYNV